MKHYLIMKKWLLIVTLVLWVVSVPVIVIIVNNYIEAKDNRLRKEFSNAITNIFNGREYIDVVYSGRKVSYEKKEIPEKPEILLQDQDSIQLLFNKKKLSKWNENYGDLYEMYQLKNDRKKWDVPYEEEDGWELIKISSSYDNKHNACLVQQWIFPYAVGYKKQDYSFSYDYTPSIRTAVNQTFDFLTTDQKSPIYEKFSKGSFYRIFNEVYQIENKYYFIFQDSIPGFWVLGETIYGNSPRYADENIGGRIVSPMEYTYMHNGYYRVFVGITQPTTWSIKRRDWVVESDQSNLLKWWLISSGIFFAIIITVLSIFLYQRFKRISESDYDKLLRLSHPRNFMKPYDKDKVEKANLIYKELDNINKNDSDAINTLIQRCIDELNISFIDQTQLSELKRIVNPERFMNPYDAQKVHLANHLFSILNSDKISFIDFKEVSSKAKTLE